MIPAQQRGGGAFLDHRYVNIDRVQLADTIESPDTLFEQVGVPGQIEHHQMVAELEVAPFGADFRADQHLAAAIVVGKGGGRAIAFDQAHLFMENRCLDAGAHA